MHRTPLRAGLHDYQDLMRYRILHILLVATPYDRFLLEEAGELSERMLGEFRNLDVHYAPGLTGVSTGAEALDLLQREASINLVITTPHVPDMSPDRLAWLVKDLRDVPVVLLAWDPSELSGVEAEGDSPIERVFLWQGDARILQAIVKSVEDWRNVEHDTRSVGVQVILLIEDNVRHYSSFLPVMYAELLEQSQGVIAEGLNLSQKILRMRARPKVLLCTDFDQAQRAFGAFGGDVLGIISDVEFPVEPGGKADPGAGVSFAKQVRATYEDIPIVLHSSKRENERLARPIRARFLLKGSAHLLEDLRKVMEQDFGFGPFIFRRGDETEVDRADDLRSLEEKLKTIPPESLFYHGRRNHFSRWLKARTEFALAHALRARKLEDYGGNADKLRSDLIQAIADYRFERGQTVVADFDRDHFAGPGEAGSDFYRIGGGSLGGKARGLAFVRRLIAQHGLRNQLEGIRIAIPTTAVLGTDVFDRFLDTGGLRAFAIDSQDDEELWQRFLETPFPEKAQRDLVAFLKRVRQPLAVRSSSLLEDSLHQPFTGVYDTLMLRNNAGNNAGNNAAGAGSLEKRVRQAVLAVKRVWASTFSQHAKSYLQATAFRLEEEKMAVMLQAIVGAVHGPRFYPDLSGVARSHNFYPIPPMTSADGIVAVALGLGRAIVEGGACLRFCPRYPRHVPQLSSVADALKTTQREFWALRLDGDDGNLSMREEVFGLGAAEADGTLSALASTYSRENDAIYDSLARPGPRVITFAPMLKHDCFPLPEILKTLMDVGYQGLGAPVEIEFAVNLQAKPQEFGFLQVRPLALAREMEVIEIGEVKLETALCWSQKVLGNGRIEGLRDLVVVDFQRFERSRSREAAAEIGRLNSRLLAEGTPYVLIGVGRWGSRDPWLGIPVTWDQVAGAKVIVEAGLRDFKVTPSQGSHFFQNLTSFNVGYFTLNAEDSQGLLDWDWLDAQPAESAQAYVRHLRLPQPVLVKMNGRKGEGVILKKDNA